MILRTRLPDGCLLSLRLPSNDYCPTVRWNGIDLRLGLDERTIVASGSDCELDNPNGYPVIDLP